MMTRDLNAEAALTAPPNVTITAVIKSWDLI